MGGGGVRRHVQLKSAFQLYAHKPVAFSSWVCVRARVRVFWGCVQRGGVGRNRNDLSEQVGSGLGGVGRGQDDAQDKQTAAVSQVP